MTENAFPFEGAVEDSAGGDRRKMVLMAGVGALLVAVLGYFVVMPAFSGDGTDVTFTTSQPAPKANTKAPAKTVAKKKAPAAPKPYSGDLSGRKNPFYPLWTEPKEATAAAPAPAEAPAGYVPPMTGDTTGGDTTTGTPDTPTAGPQRVVLMSVFTKDKVSYAQTKVGEAVYLPRVGGTFATSFKLIEVTSVTATYLFGDEQFTLSVGQETWK